METLYHKTNQTILEITECFQKLSHMNPVSINTDSLEAEILDKINIIKNNCGRLDILVQKEPISRRQNCKLKVDQLKYDSAHFYNAYQKYLAEKNRKLLESKEREELLNRRFAKNSLSEDTTILIDHSVQHQKSLKDSNRRVDDLISSGSSILDNLRNQRDTLKSAHRRLMDLGNILGLSNTTMRLIERRAREDKYILIGGMVLTLIFITFVIFYLT